MIQKWYAESLAEYYEHIATIGRFINERECTQDKEYNEDRAVLWFRGHEYRYFNLIPNLFRGTECKYNSVNTYSSNHLREDYRFQQFMARNYDKLDPVPNSVIEWQQVMQHYFTKTRLMDWSESAEIAISFALESYLNPLADEELNKKRMNASPVVWILEPLKLNDCVYNMLLQEENGTYPLIERALQGLESRFKIKQVATKIGKELKYKDEEKEHKKIYFSTGDLNENNIIELEKESYHG